MPSHNTELSDPTTTETGHPNRWAVLWILCGSLVIVVVSVSSLNVAIPAIQRSLGTSGSELQWIIDAYALTFAGLLLPAGAVGDRYGRREALLGGLAVFGLASVGGMLAGSAGELIAWRALMGAGAAFIMPATLSIIATVFPPAERGRAIAIWAGFAGAGGAIGLLSSGLLLEAFWWGSVFLVNVPMVIIMVVAVVLIVPTSRDPEATPLDPIGGVLSVIGLGALVFGIIEGPEVGWGSTTAMVSFAIATVALVAFVFWELNTRYPMLDPRFFTKREFSLGSIVITLAFFGIFGMFFAVTQYLQFVQEYSALEAAVRILPYGLVLLVVSPRSATLSARFGSRPVMVGGLILAAIGFGGLALVRPDTAYLHVGSALVLVALGTGLLMPPATTALVASLPPEKAGVGSAMNDTTREVGGSIGIAVVGALLSIGYRDGLGSALDNAPVEVAEAGHDSIGGLLAAAAELPDAIAGPLLETGRLAFTDGMRLGMGAAAATLVVAAALVAAFYPSPEETS
ncbi:MAG: MFS transporter [Acidimicrobiales bacterium]